MSKVTIKDKVTSVQMRDMKTGEFAEVLTGMSAGEIVFMHGSNGYVSVVGCAVMVGATEILVIYLYVYYLKVQLLLLL